LDVSTVKEASLWIHEASIDADKQEEEEAEHFIEKVTRRHRLALRKLQKESALRQMSVTVAQLIRGAKRWAIQSMLINSTAGTIQMHDIAHNWHDRSHALQHIGFILLGFLHKRVAIVFHSFQINFSIARLGLSAAETQRQRKLHRDLLIKSTASKARIADLMRSGRQSSAIHHLVYFIGGVLQGKQGGAMLAMRLNMKNERIGEANAAAESMRRDLRDRLKLASVSRLAFCLAGIHRGDTGACFRNFQMKQARAQIDTAARATDGRKQGRQACAMQHLSWILTHLHNGSMLRVVQAMRLDMRDEATEQSQSALGHLDATGKETQQTYAVRHLAWIWADTLGSTLRNVFQRLRLNVTVDNAEHALQTASKQRRDGVVRNAADKAKRESASALARHRTALQILGHAMARQLTSELGVAFHLLRISHASDRLEQTAQDAKAKLLLGMRASRQGQAIRAMSYIARRIVQGELTAALHQLRTQMQLEREEQKGQATARVSALKELAWMLAQTSSRVIHSALRMLQGGLERHKLQDSHKVTAWLSNDTAHRTQVVSVQRMAWVGHRLFQQDVRAVVTLWRQHHHQAVLSNGHSLTAWIKQEADANQKRAAARHMAWFLHHDAQSSVRLVLQAMRQGANRSRCDRNIREANAVAAWLATRSQAAALRWMASIVATLLTDALRRCLAAMRAHQRSAGQAVTLELATLQLHVVATCRRQLAEQQERLIDRDIAIETALEFDRERSKLEQSLRESKARWLLRALLQLSRLISRFERQECILVLTALTTNVCLARSLEAAKARWVDSIDGITRHYDEWQQEKQRGFVLQRVLLGFSEAIQGQRESSLLQFFYVWKYEHSPAWVERAEGLLRLQNRLQKEMARLREVEASLQAWSQRPRGAGAPAANFACCRRNTDEA